MAFAEPKYRKGKPLTSPNQVLRAFHSRPPRWIYYNHKAMHPSFLVNMSLWNIARMIGRSGLCWAVPFRSKP